MSAYAAPLEDLRFLFEEVLDFDNGMAALFPDLGIDTALAMSALEEAGHFCADVLHPLNRSGDEEGCRLEAGQVVTATGFREAYAGFVAAGWAGLSGDPAYGGQGLPRTLQLALDEMVSATNMSFGLFPGLTRGATEALAHHADDTIKATYLSKMISGEWTGVMALTEASAGTDLGLLSTRAVPNGDGSYAVTGTKIFISSGDHDFGGNIVHLVLARLPDAPKGVKGISLFVVPKFLVNPDGSLGARNPVHVGSLEHKMGIHAQPTCVMNYEGATGWLVGEANRGLAAMFTMMNAERLFVGIQGLGVAHAAYQTAASYAKERLQGRSPDGTTAPAPIIVHADVRRMLLTIRAFVEPARALALWTATQMDRAGHHPDADTRRQADGLVALLTPVIKAAFTDFALESTVLAQQVFGGHGYIRETGVEQLVRDARITQIYEGTNGVQAADLAGRKLLMEGGRLPEAFFAQIAADLAAARLVPGAAEIAGPVADALDRLRTLTADLQRHGEDVVRTGAAATDYLRFFALVALGWMWVRMAAASLSKGTETTPFHRAKVDLAQFFMAKLLPQTLGLEQSIKAGPATLMALDGDLF